MTTELSRPPLSPPSFDPAKYHLGIGDDNKLNPSALTFFKKATRIDDEDELRRHIVEVSRRAYEDDYPYRCIYTFSHTDLRMSTHPAYPLAVAQADVASERFRVDHVFVDVGTCFGGEPRKLIMDGWDGQRVFALDIRQSLIDGGYALFRDSPQTCPITFIVGDVFLDSFCDPHRCPPSPSSGLPPPSPTSPPKDISSLHGKATCVYAGSLFHLFDEASQLNLARRLASLLSISTDPTKPALIFGRHRGRTEAGMMDDRLGRRLYGHSPDSWTRLWEGAVFGPKEDGKVGPPDGTKLRVNVRAGMPNSERGHTGEDAALNWSDKQVGLLWSVEVWRGE